MKIANIQYMRAIAALLVIFVHISHQVGEYSQRIPPFGGIGVDLFFVISGFIMVWISKASDSPTRFMTKRIRRIAPLYWTMTLAMSSVVFTFPDLFKTAVLDIEHIIKSLLFIPHFHPNAIEEVRPMLGPGWTLNYEMYFYLVFSISLIFPDKYRTYIILCIIVFLFALSHSIESASSAMTVFLSNSIVFEFAAGTIVGKAYVSGFRLNQYASLTLIAVALVTMLLLSGPHRGITNGIPALIFFVGCLNLKLPPMKFLHHIGDASYSIYLSHLFTLGLCRSILPNIFGYSLAATLIFVVISYATSIAVGLLVYRYIEQGLLRWRPKRASGLNTYP